MYDLIKVELPLPGTSIYEAYADVLYQTKSLSRELKTYVISNGGQLYTESVDGDSILRDYLTDFSGEIRFTLDGSNSYIATFENGRIRKLSYTRN